MGEGPPLVFVHGFPELWFSWRHQLARLAAAGYQGIAPDLRGYGGSSAPAEQNAYDILTLSGDLVGILDAYERERAVFVGHDWGAQLVWELARIHPDRVAGVVGLSVPYVPRPPRPPVELLREGVGEDFYIVWFQQPGVAEEALSRNVRRTLATTKPWSASWAEQDDEPPCPRWMTEEELAVYVEAFERTGFTGALNYDRNLDRNWHLTADLADRTIAQPAMFIRGSRDPVASWLPAEIMDGWVKDLRASVTVEGAGHWVQQERPDAVNDALISFCRDIGYGA